MDRDKFRLLASWAGVAVITFIGWPLFLYLGPFEGNVVIVCGFFSIVCGVYFAAGIITFAYYVAITESRERRRGADGSMPERKEKAGEDMEGELGEREEDGREKPKGQEGELGEREEDGREKPKGEEGESGEREEDRWEKSKGQEGELGEDEKGKPEERDAGVEERGEGPGKKERVAPAVFGDEMSDAVVLRNLISIELELPTSKIFRIPEGMAPRTAYELAKSEIIKRGAGFVRESIAEEPFAAEALFHGETGEKKMQRTIILSVLGEANSIALRGSAKTDDDGNVSPGGVR